MKGKCGENDDSYGGRISLQVMLHLIVESSTTFDGTAPAIERRENFIRCEKY